MPRETVPPAVCPGCRRHPPLLPAPFCAACLLAQGSPATTRGQAGDPGPHLAAGTVVGRYEIVERLGEGGFAEVYSVRPRLLAEGNGAPTVLALKIIKRGMDSREILARFQAEQRAVRALAHPSIVPLIEAGFTVDGLPYFAMAQVDGLPVTDYCQVSRLSLRRRVELFLPLCDAVQHAHQRGVLHRDLKPSNILVEETDLGPVPRVIDFGIAKALEPGGTGDTHVTRLGLVLGTPTYMSPEQAAGHDEADTRSDIYSLGAVLYEVLVGVAPFDAAALARLRPGEWARHLRENFPALPAARLKAAGGPPAEVRWLRGDLDLIVRKAMASDPDRRYASAAALAGDLQAWLDDRPVSAHPPTVREVVRQFVRRHRWPVAVGVSILLGIVATAGIGTSLAIQARRAEGRAIAERNRALAAEHVAGEARERSERQNYQASVETAALHLERNEPYLAADRLRDTPERLRGWEWGYLMAAIAQPEAAADSGLENPTTLATTPDGRFAAVASGHDVAVVDVSRNRVAGRSSFDAKVESLALSDDGRRLAVVQVPPGPNLLCVSLVEGGEKWSLPLSSTTDVAWEPTAVGGALLLVSGNGPTPAPGRLARFDAATGRVLNERSITRWKVHSPALSVGSGGTMAAAENSYKDLEVFSLPDLRPLTTDGSPTGEAIDTFLLDDRRDRLVVGRGGRIAVGPASRDGRAPAGEMRRPADDGKEGLVSATAVAPPDTVQIRHFNWLADGRWVAVSDALRLVEGEDPRPLPLTGGGVFLPLTGGRTLALGRSGRLEIRPELPVVGPGEAMHAFFGGEYPEGRGVAFAPDARRVFFQGWTRDRLEDIPLGGPPPVDDPPPLASLPRQPQAEWTALPVALADGSVLVRDGAGLAAVRPGGVPVPIPGTAEAWSADGSPDGRLLAVGVPTGVRLLDGRSHALLREWLLPAGPFRVLLPPPGRGQGAVVVAVSRESSLHCLPVDGGAPSVLPVPFQVNGYYPAPMAFHPASGLLAGAVEGGFAVYDLRSLPSAPLLRRRCTCAPVTALGFTRYTHRLAVGTEDHRLTLWDWEQALPLLGFPIRSYCASVAFSPDGEWLAYTDYRPSLVLRRAEPRPPGR